MHNAAIQFNSIQSNQLKILRVQKFETESREDKCDKHSNSRKYQRREEKRRGEEGERAGAPNICRVIRLRDRDLLLSGGRGRDMCLLQQLQHGIRWNGVRVRRRGRRVVLLLPEQRARIHIRRLLREPRKREAQLQSTRKEKNQIENSVDMLVLGS